MVSWILEERLGQMKYVGPEDQIRHVLPYTQNLIQVGLQSFIHSNETTTIVEITPYLLYVHRRI